MVDIQLMIERIKGKRKSEEYVQHNFFCYGTYEQGTEKFSVELKANNMVF